MQDGKLSEKAHQNAEYQNIYNVNFLIFQELSKFHDRRAAWTV